jgi:hypothetical protein
LRANGSEPEEMGWWFPTAVLALESSRKMWHGLSVITRPMRVPLLQGVRQ